MANTKQLQNKKLGLLKNKASIESLVAGYKTKLLELDAEIVKVNDALEEEVGELQRMIDEIRNGVQPVAEAIVEVDTDGDFN